MTSRWDVRFGIPFALVLLGMAEAIAPAGELRQAQEDFSTDPGWEAIHNRVIGEGGPTVRQDFGWRAADNGRGAVGGTVWSGLVPATYGMPIGPFDLKRKLTASGKITIKQMDYRSGAYIGFYNSTRQGWRPWSSMVLQLGSQVKPPGPGPEAGVILTILPADWRSDGVSNDARIPIDGKPHAWSFTYDPQAQMPDGRTRSEVTLEVDGKPFKGYPETADTRDHPAVMDRFGIVNNQSYGDSCEFYLSDVTIDGRPIDLSRDPGWEGRGNRVTFQAEHFHGRHDYGYMQTNWAGQAPGELGGIFWGTEVEDPTHGYYADDVGTLTLDDPLSFSATACFVDGQPDSGMAIGYFNSKEVMTELPKGTRGFPVHQSLGLFIEGPSSVGKTLMAFCSPRQELSSLLPNPPLFQPTRERRRIEFHYDPQANNGVGRSTMKLDDAEYTIELTPEQRRTGATFDRFGVMNLRGGGKCVIIYFDDIRYTTGRSTDVERVRHKQEFTRVPYPAGGRRY